MLDSLDKRIKLTRKACHAKRPLCHTAHEAMERFPVVESPLGAGDGATLAPHWDADVRSGAVATGRSALSNTQAPTSSPCATPARTAVGGSPPRRGRRRSRARLQRG